ncbi:Vegetative protein 296 [subsurface metagenome]
MLDIKELTVEVEDREILHDINLTIRTGETHVLFGPNGSGKTTLIMTIMGFPKYKITKGSILFQGKDITGLTLPYCPHIGLIISRFICPVPH